MSLISLLFGTRAPGSAVIGGFEMDVTLEEQHERSAQVTDAPVESGVRIADHVILDPERVNLEGFITSAPVRILPLGRASVGRVLDAFDTLDALWRAREPVTLVTGYRVYDDMVITRLDLPRSRQVGLRFRAELQRVRRVESEVGFLAVGEDVEDAAAPEVDAGRQPTREASEATGQRTSFLRQLWDFGAGIFQ